MSTSNKALLLDLNGAPIAQYYNSTGDVYEEVRGRNNAPRVELYGADGNPLFPSAAAAMADNTALPTAPIVRAGLLAYDGATLDMVRSGDVNNVASAVGFLDALMVGRYNATLPTLTDGRWSAVQLTPGGALWTGLVNAAGNAITTLSPSADALGTTSTLLGAAAYGHGFNGTGWDRIRTQADSGTTGILMATPAIWDTTSSAVLRQRSARSLSDGDPFAYAPGVGTYRFNATTWDRERGNTEAAYLASAARTASTVGADLVTYNARSLVFVINVTANPGGAETLAGRVQYKDVSGNYVTAANVTTMFTAANGIAAVCVGGNGAVSAGVTLGGLTRAIDIPLLRTIRLIVDHSAAGSWTYSVSAHLSA